LISRPGYSGTGYAVPTRNVPTVASRFKTVDVWSRGDTIQYSRTPMTLVELTLQRQILVASTRRQDLDYPVRRCAATVLIVARTESSRAQ